MEHLVKLYFTVGFTSNKIARLIFWHISDYEYQDFEAIVQTIVSIPTEEPSGLGWTFVAI